MVQTFAETARSVLRRLRREVVRLRRQSISHGHAPSISLFLPSLAGGGAERITLALAEGFVHRGFQVDLVLAVAQGPYLAQVPPGVRVVNLAARNVMAKLVALTGYLRRERPSVLLSSLDNVNIATCAKHLARASTRVILGVHNTVSRDLAGQRGFIGRLKPVLLRLMYPRADGIVAVSQGVARDLTATARLPSTRVHVIYNPVVTADLLDRAEEPLGHPWFGPGEPPVVLAVGRLTPQKDFSTLIRAFAQARQQHAARLVILGEGEEHSALETLARDLKVADHIAFCGFVANPYAWMARSAMLVLSSRWEGLPTVLIEALAVGIPVVSTDCESGPREILDNGRFGALVPVAHPTALADAIVETLRTVPDRTLLQERSREFGVEHSLDCYLDVFQSPLRRG